jgi:hypothetical protein
MAKFDFIESAGKAYQYVWTNRQDLARPSAFVIAAKFACYAIVFIAGVEDNFLRQGLILMPSYFVEGWIIAHIMLKALSNEKDRAYQIPRIAPENIQNTIITSMVVYVLLKLLLSFFVGLPGLIDPQALSAAGEQEASASDAMLFIGALGFMVFAVWFFRFIWLYVPPALGFSMTGYLRKIGPLNGSYYLIGLWLICFVPLAIALIICSQIVSIPFGTGAEELSAGHKYVLSFLQGIFDYVMILVSSLGMAYGVASMFNKEDKTVSLL